MLSKVLSIFVLSLFMCDGALAENAKPSSNFSEYIPLSFDKIVQDHKLGRSRPGTQVDKKHNMVFDTDVHPLAFKVEYDGKVRDLPKSRVEFQKYFSKSVQKSHDDFFSKHRKEIEVREGSKKYWVAVQNQTLESLKDIKAAITIYVRYLGQIGEDPICFVMDFTVSDKN